MRRGHSLCSFAFFLTAALLIATPAFAKVQLYADVGWSNQFRPGRWTPMYLTLSDSAPRQVILEIYNPTDRRYAMKIRQSLAIGPQAVTVPIYVPTWYQLDSTTITVRDANSYSRLADLMLADPSAGIGQGQSAMPTAVAGNVLFAGISGNGGTERLLEGQFRGDTVATGFLPPERLPAAPVGYDGLDLLILNAPDLNRIGIDQQRAIADWVRAGGLLLLWPGADPVPSAAPLVEILPCAIGDNRAFTANAAAVGAAGLGARFAKLKGRDLRDAAPDAKPIDLLGDHTLTGYRHWVGYGQVAVLPVDASLLVFTDAAHATDFWRRVLGGFIEIPAVDINNPNAAPYMYAGNVDVRQQAALHAALDWIGNVPGAGEFGFSYLALTMLGMMCIVGPLDWFVLKWLGRQPWTWVTITGWMGVVTFGAIYIGHLVKSGDLVFRTVTMVDEAGGTRAATVDLAGIYSPQTRAYELDVEPESWWWPASDGMNYGASGLQVEIPCHQDYRGNRPQDLVINVWNLRLLQGETFQSAAPLIEAKLSTNAAGEVAGTITNRGPLPIEKLRVRTRAGVATIGKSIEPGQSLEIAQKLDARDRTLTTMPSQDNQTQWQWYQQQQTAGGDRPRFPLLNGLADLRAARIDQMLADRGDVAVVYAEFAGGAEDRVKLKQPDGEQPAKEAHVGAVRAVVALRPQQP